jgi:hypothetical protein
MDSRLQATWFAKIFPTLSGAHLFLAMSDHVTGQEESVKRVATHPKMGLGYVRLRCGLLARRRTSRTCVVHACGDAPAPGLRTRSIGRELASKPGVGMAARRARGRHVPERLPVAPWFVPVLLLACLLADPGTALGGSREARVQLAQATEGEACPPTEAPGPARPLGTNW